MSDRPLAGKTAIITGAARGIGRAICLRLAREGASVVVNYRTSESAAKEVAELARQQRVEALAVCADVSSEQQVQSMVEEVESRLGPVDLLVNNAAVFDYGPHEQTTSENWQRTIDTNLTGAFHMIWAVKEGMIQRRYGRIVNIASIAGIRARPSCIAYSVSKAGLIMLTKSVSAAVAEFDIRINCVAPGLIDTEMPRVAGDDRLQALVDATPLKRIGNPDEIAQAAYFLLSEESSFMTGQTIAVSGGRVLLP